MNSISSTYSYKTFLISAFLILLGAVFLGYGIFYDNNNQIAVEETIWVIDTSLSMAVEDVSGGSSNTLKSRLDLAKSIILSGSSIIPGDHGIVSYARSAGVLLPLSHEKIYRENIVTNISPTLLYGGSSVQDAFSLVRSLYTTHSKPMHIILLTDGGDSDMGDLPLLQITSKVSIIGIGTLEGGKIPLGYNNDGERRYKKFQENDIIVHLEKKNIESIGKTYQSTPLYIDNWGKQESIITTLLKNHGNKNNPTGNFLEKVMRSFFLFFGTFLILLGYMISPYKKPKI